jgi:succinoglycan biosynthesis protein ExoA
MINTVLLLNGTSQPTISVIIPCRNEARHIESCLRGVLAFEPPPGGFEVVVADGFSHDGTREIVARIAREDSRVRLIDNPARTTPCGLNAAIRSACGEFIVRIDAHSTYAVDYLRQCLAVIQETGVDNVGGPALTQANTYIQRAIAAAFHSRFAVGNGTFHQPDYEGPADTVPYGCYSRSRLVELGLFDEELVRNQDDELNFRLVRSGGKIWQSPRIKSWYNPRDSLSNLFRQYWQYGYWKVRVIQKHGTPASWRHLVPASFVAALILFALATPLFAAAHLALFALAQVYALALLAASLTTAANRGWALLPALPVVFACYHLGYGLGFLIGVWDFILRRRSAGRFVALTRR